MTVAAPIALMPGSAVFLELPLAGLLFAVAHHLLHFTVHRAHAARASSAATVEPPLQSFVTGLGADQDAVVAGLTLQWSSGRREGRPDGGLAIDRSTVYNVGMAMRAMQEATFMILTALANGSQHGYGIVADVEEISGGRVQLRAGTLYTALDRLRADELIEVDREEIVDGRLRRYYRLTPAGTTRLAAEAARLQAHATVALTRLDLAGGMAT
jgi:DNA-binding PadR family transcriptional regulator